MLWHARRQVRSSIAFSSIVLSVRVRVEAFFLKNNRTWYAQRLHSEGGDLSVHHSLSSPSYAFAWRVGKFDPLGEYWQRVVQLVDHLLRAIQ